MQLESDYSGNQHGKRLTEHRRFGLNSSHAPAENAEAVDHRGVRIGANQRIGKGRPYAVFFCAEHHAREIFEIYLVANSGIRRDNLEIIETLLSPAQKAVALDVTLHFQVSIETERIRGSEPVDLHR